MRFVPQLDGVVERGVALHPALVDEHGVVLQRELHARGGVGAWPGEPSEGERECEQAQAGGEGAGHLVHVSAIACAGLNPAGRLRFRAVLAVYAAHINADDPLSGLVRRRAARAGRARRAGRRSTVRAASLNHHDLWSLRGVGLPAERLPMILGCDAAGVDADGREVIVHSVISDDGWRGDETLDPRRSMLSERHPGTFAERVAVPRRNLVPKPPELSLRRGGVPADRVADRLPDAVHARAASCRG